MTTQEHFIAVWIAELARDRKSDLTSEFITRICGTAQHLQLDIATITKDVLRTLPSIAPVVVRDGRSASPEEIAAHNAAYWIWFDIDRKAKAIYVENFVHPRK